MPLSFFCAYQRFFSAFICEKSFFKKVLADFRRFKSPQIFADKETLKL